MSAARTYYFRYLTGALEFSHELSGLLRRRIEVEQVPTQVYHWQAGWWKADLLPADLGAVTGVGEREADVFARNAARLHEHEGEEPVLRIFGPGGEEVA